MKDYYAILGVSPNAEPEVISAAYKSLAKKYHPDVYQGTKKEAEKRIREINEAYSHLSNRTKKDKYDKEYSKNKTAGNFDDFSNNEFDENLNVFDKDWEILIEVFPNAEKLRIDLSKLSQKLSLLFQVVLLEKKMGAKAQQVASSLKKEFLERYFGTNNKIQELASKALINNEIEIAKEINKKITLLGDDAADKIYTILSQKLEKNIYLKKKKNDPIKPNRSQKKTSSNYKYSSKKETFIKYVIGIPLLLLLMIASIYHGPDSSVSSNSNLSYNLNSCLTNPEKCNDEMLCDQAVYINSDGSYEWNSWSEGHVELAKERNLDCNVYEVKENKIQNYNLDSMLSSFQKEICMKNSKNCNHETLCYFATEVINGIIEWHSIAKEYVNLAQDNNYNCKVGQVYKRK